MTFILLSGIFLSAWFVFWEVRSGHLANLARFFGLLPVGEETRTDLDTVVILADSLLQTDGKEKTFLILFQNNMELRPGGGFIGSFGILKVRDGHITHFDVHDTGNFDGRIPSTVAPPYPMKETLRIDSWKLRDSNYSPDFPENAKQAVNFYQMGNGQEHFDGVAAVTANVLSSFLRVTGPVRIEGFPGEYGADNAILDLEYQVEQGYRKQNIAPGDRKSVLNLLGEEILRHVIALNPANKYHLFRVLLDDLHRKDIQLHFEDNDLQAQVEGAGWSGAMDGTWKNDYLLAVDANLGAFKSDYYVKRSYDYTVDLRGDVPQAVLAVTYEHTATEKSYLTKEYQSFLRVYVPHGSFLTTVTNATTQPVYGDFLNKKYFGVLVNVPLHSTKTVTFAYTLPKDLERDFYDLKIEKQAGLNDVPVHIKVLHQDGSVEEKSFVLNRNTVLSTLPE